MLVFQKLILLFFTVIVLACISYWIELYGKCPSKFCLEDPKRKIMLFKSSKNATSRFCSMAERTSFVKNMCAHFGFTNDLLTQRRTRVIIHDQYKIVYCPIVKCGSTNFLRFLGSLTEKNSSTKFWERPHFDIRGMRARGLRVQKMTSKEINLLPYLKIMIVRHPLDRFLSAYYDKMNNSVQRWWTARIKEKIVRNYNKTNQTGSDYEFEFWKFADSLFHLRGVRNPHWNSFALMCNPCAINFDAIIRLETMQHDQKYFLNHLNQTEEMFSRHTVLRRCDMQSSQALQKHCSDWTKRKLPEYKDVSMDTKQRLVTDFYRYDLEMFGYSFNYSAHEADCLLTTNSGQQCC